MLVDPCPLASPSSPSLWLAFLASSLFLERIPVLGPFRVPSIWESIPWISLGWFLSQIPDHPIQRQCPLLHLIAVSQVTTGWGKVGLQLFV